MKWAVEVLVIGTDEVVRSILCDSERKAEKVERGVAINMDHENYYTRIVEAEEEEGEDKQR